VWGALAVAAWFLGDHDWKVRAVVCALGLVVVEVAVILLKMVFRRRRPPGELGRIYRRADPYSFPSGHAARAALLCILAWQLGPVVAIVAIAIWSPVMVLSRIAVGIHYAFDVVAGVILGCGLTAALLLAVPMVAARV
jgi:undecaprenyl-diphosphatase